MPTKGAKIETSKTKPICRQKIELVGLLRRLCSNAIFVSFDKYSTCNALETNRHMIKISNYCWATVVTTFSCIHLLAWR